MHLLQEASISGLLQYLSTCVGWHLMHVRRGVVPGAAWIAAGGSIRTSTVYTLDHPRCDLSAQSTFYCTQQGQAVQEARPECRLHLLLLPLPPATVALTHCRLQPPDATVGPGGLHLLLCYRLILPYSSCDRRQAAHRRPRACALRHHRHLSAPSLLRNPLCGIA